MTFKNENKNGLKENERKEKLKKKRRKENFILVSAVCLAIVVFLGSKYALSVYKENNSNVSQSKQNSEKQKDTITEKQTTTEEIKENTNGIDLSESGNFIKSAESYAYSVTEIREYILSNKEYNGKKMVFLTFDDGVTPGITDRVLDILKEKQVPATFFIVGKTLNDESKPYLERELKEGHSLAIHSFTHDYNKLYPGRVPNVNVIKEEAEKTLNRLKELLGDKFKTGVWRYPGGHMSWKGLDSQGNADEVLKQMGLEWIDWNSLNGDAEPLKTRPTTQGAMLEFVKTSLSYWKQQNVVVVLMHDSVGKELTVQTLPSIIEHFKSQGYEFGILK